MLEVLKERYDMVKCTEKEHNLSAFVLIGQGRNLYGFQAEQRRGSPMVERNG